MKKVSHKPFEIWLEQQNTHDRVQPITGIKSDVYLINLQLHHTPKPSVWQRVRGWL